jgi:hypothetical protein
LGFQWSRLTRSGSSDTADLFFRPGQILGFGVVNSQSFELDQRALCIAKLQVAIPELQLSIVIFLGIGILEHVLERLKRARIVFDSVGALSARDPRGSVSRMLVKWPFEASYCWASNA